MKIVKFTDNELMVARQMLEVALKALGRQAVGAFAVLDKKLEEAADEVEDTLVGDT